MVESNGFRLDNGPTVMTMPNLLEDAFNAVGTEMRDYVTIKKWTLCIGLCMPTVAN